MKPTLMVVRIVNPSEKRELIYDVTEIVNAQNGTSIIWIGKKKFIQISTHRILTITLDK